MAILAKSIVFKICDIETSLPCDREKVIKHSCGLGSPILKSFMETAGTSESNSKWSTKPLVFIRDPVAYMGKHPSRGFETVHGREPSRTLGYFILGNHQL